jgi:Zn-dependent peptidase ImmA (M78 family)/plasmid maintenance system antidote protein VapI
MKDILARNIRRRRQILGLDQGQMADRIGVSRITFSKYENGKAAITDDVFYRLSRIFGISPAALLESPDRQSAPLFRHKKVYSQQERASLDQMILDAERKFEDYDELESFANERIESSELLSMQRRVASADEARAFGTEVRACLFRQGFDNVRRFGEALEANGIKFLSFAFPLSSEFGFSLKLPNGSCGIAVNNGDAVPGERQLFTLCHEVGHLLMHHQDDATDDSPETKRRREKEANAFAAGMLIPSAEFNSAWDNTDGRLWFDRILAVKRIFTVSYLTVIYCLEERYRATSGKKTVPPYRNWFKENYLRRFGRTLPAHEEACPADVRIESARFIRLARKAFVAGDITMPRLAELLGKSLLDTRALVNEWAREAAE